jgi:hypothetical protein
MIPRIMGMRSLLIDEHQALGIKVELTLKPRPALPQDVGAVLLDCVAGSALGPSPGRPVACAYLRVTA